jgi:hypothetical protein
MANLEVAVEFASTAQHRALFYRGAQVVLDPDGKGSLSVPTNEDQAILAEIRGAQPGSEVTIKLAVEAPAEIQMAEFKGRVAQNRTVWASSRFFRVKS